jgi:hypothetical protein
MARLGAGALAAGVEGDGETGESSASAGISERNRDGARDVER